MKIGWAFAMGIGVALIAKGAAAHPGAKILSYGGGDGQAAATPGIEFNEVNGVHIFSGERASGVRDGDPLEGAGPRKIIRIKRVKQTHTWRRLRRLRTQGFYSGTQYPSRAYTQGFYADH